MKGVLENQQQLEDSSVSLVSTVHRKMVTERRAVSVFALTITERWTPCAHLCYPQQSCLIVLVRESQKNLYKSRKKRLICCNVQIAKILALQHWCSVGQPGAMLQLPGGCGMSSCALILLSDVPLPKHSGLTWVWYSAWIDLTLFVWSRLAGAGRRRNEMKTSSSPAIQSSWRQMGIIISEA